MNDNVRIAKTMVCQKLLNLSNANVAMAFVDRASASFNTNIFMLCVLVIGMLTNSAFLFTLIRVTRMKTIPNFYFALQSIMDIIFLNVVITPIVHTKLSGFHVGHIPTSSLGCWLYYFVIAGSYTFSFSLIFFVSFDRFYAISDPLRHKVYASTGRLVKFTAIGLVFSTICAVLLCLNRSRYVRTCLMWPDEEQFSSYPHYRHDCIPPNKTTGILKWILKTVPFLIVTVCISGFYIKILSVLNDKSISKSTAPARQASVRNQVARIVICNGIIFFISFAPSTIVETIRFIAPQMANVTSMYIGEMFIFFNSGVNTLSFPILSPFYRQAYREAFCLCCNACSQSNDEEGGGDTRMENMESNTGHVDSRPPNTV